MDCSPARSVWYTCKTSQEYIRQYTGDKEQLRVILEFTDPMYADLPIVKSVDGRLLKPSYFRRVDARGKFRIVFTSVYPDQPYETGDEKIISESDLETLKTIMYNHELVNRKNPVQHWVNAYKDIFETANLFAEQQVKFLFVWVVNNRIGADPAVKEAFPYNYQTYAKNIVPPEILSLYSVTASSSMINAYNHPTKDGHQLIADSLYTYINKHNIFKG
jgi:hypothetical protein